MSFERFLEKHTIPAGSTRAKLRKFYAKVSEAFPAHVCRLLPYSELGYARLRRRTKREIERQRAAFLAIKRFY